MKYAIVAAIVIVLILGRRLHVQRQSARRTQRTGWPEVPAVLLAGAERTWIVFTTPYCAACGPVKEQLATADPGARIVTVDATREPQLAKAFAVRSAPTVLLADAGGAVKTRLVGAPAVRSYFALPSSRTA